VLLSALFLGALQLGRRVQSALRLASGSRLLSTCLGLLVVLIPEILGDALASLNAWVEISLDIVSGILTVLVLSLGLGSLVITRMGRRNNLVDDLGESATLPLAVPG
jgi:hypothetical protein